MFCISGAGEDLLVSWVLVGVLEPKWRDCFVCRKVVITYMKHNICHSLSVPNY